MARIRDAKPKESSGGYERVIGHNEMASVFVKTQSAVISNGTELEKIISSHSVLIKDLDEFINKCDDGLVIDGTYLCTKKVLKKSKLNLKGHEPDFLAFTICTHKNLCYVVELKDGYVLDTKKSQAEKDMLIAFVNHIAPKIPFRTKYYMCSFNQEDKAKIVMGFKNKFDISEVMTGREFCEILGIDYEGIINLRKGDVEDNFRYIVEQMAMIEEIGFEVVKNHRKHIIEDEFYDDVVDDE